MNKMKVLAGMTLGALMCAGSFAQDSGALVDALVKKGVLSSQEAEEIRTDLLKEASTTPAGKLSLASHINQLKLGGDIRMRYQYDQVSLQAPTAAQGADATQERNRYRARVRVNADYAFTDNLSAGLTLETEQGRADSSNSDLADAAWQKESVGLSRIVITYKPWSWAQVDLGKIKNPFYTTDLIWDGDINPAGVAEQIDFAKAFDLGDFGVKVVAGQFAYQANANNPFTGGGSDESSSSPWLFEQQVQLGYKFNKDVSVKVAPGFMTWTDGNIPATTGMENGYSGDNATQNLNVILIPGEVAWKAWDQPFKFYWDAAYNVTGKDRIQDTYLNPSGGTGTLTTLTNAGTNNVGTELGDNVAWLAGISVGQLKKKHDWMAEVNFRQIGLGAIDPNLTDSDFAFKRPSSQGVKVGVGYAFTDFLYGNIAYFETWDYKSNLVGNAAPIAQGGQLGGARILQIDATLKF